MAINIWAQLQDLYRYKQILQHTARFARDLANFAVPMLSWQFLHSLAHSASQATVGKFQDSCRIKI